jgi:hypothetical protein
MTGVPPSWSANEHPNPLPGDVSLPVGCPVSISLPWAKEGQLDVKSASLYIGSGSKIDSLLLTPATDPNKLLKQDIFLVPRKPLADRTTYRAAFELVVNGADFSRAWYFVTGSRSQ